MRTICHLDTLLLKLIRIDYLLPNLAPGPSFKLALCPLPGFRRTLAGGSHNIADCLNPQRARDVG